MSGGLGDKMNTEEENRDGEGDARGAERVDNDEAMERACRKVHGGDINLEAGPAKKRCNRVQQPSNKSGNILQVEYAQICASKAEPSVGMIARNGVVIVSEKKLGSRLMDSSTVFKMAKISEFIGMVHSGIEADFRQVTTVATKIATSYLVSQDQPIPVNILVKDLGDNLKGVTKSARVRPFGLGLLIAGWHKNRAHLYKMNCTGSFQSVKAVAIGRNAEVCTAYLERYHTDAMALDAAISLAVETLKLASANNSIRAEQIAAGYSDKNGFQRMTDCEVIEVLEILA